MQWKIKTWCFSFQMAGLLKLLHWSTSGSTDTLLFHCIQPDSKQPLIYFKLAALSGITSNCTTMLLGRSDSYFLRSHSSPDVELHTYACTHQPDSINLRLILNLQHGLSEHWNVPSCSEEDLAFLFPDHRAAQTTTRKCKPCFGGCYLIAYQTT